jgi:hypothetical protein
MLPLQASLFPTSPELLRQALTDGLTKLGASPKEIVVEGGDFPRVERLQIDLTGASISQAPPLVKARQALDGTLHVDALLLFAAPLVAAGSPVQIRLEARDADLREYSAEPIERLLALEKAADGKLFLEIQRDDLQSLVHFIAREAARQHGADITSLTLQLQATGGRQLELESEVVAKFGFVKATLHLTGRAMLDDDLQLHLSDLQVKGSGMAAGLATSFIKPQLEKLQRQPIALAAHSLSGLRLRDVRVTTGDAVRLEAEFGG